MSNDIEYTKKQLNADMRSIFVNQYNLFSAFPHHSGPLRNWQTLFYHAWGITKRSATRIMNLYYEQCFLPEKKESPDKGHTLINSEKKTKIRLHRKICV